MDVSWKKRSRSGCSCRCFVRTPPLSSRDAAGFPARPQASGGEVVGRGDGHFGGACRPSWPPPVFDPMGAPAGRPMLPPPSVQSARAAPRHSRRRMARSRSLQYQYSNSTAPLVHQCRPRAAPVQHQCSTSTVPVQYKWSTSIVPEFGGPVRTPISEGRFGGPSPSRQTPRCSRAPPPSLPRPGAQQR